MLKRLVLDTPLSEHLAQGPEAHRQTTELFTLVNSLLSVSAMIAQTAKGWPRWSEAYQGNLVTARVL